MKTLLILLATSLTFVHWAAAEAKPNLLLIIADEKLIEIRDALRARLDAWMREQGDEGQPAEMKALERMPKHSDDSDGPQKTKNKKKA